MLIVSSGNYASNQKIMNYDKKLIIVEGIPGSGKSTSAAKIKEYFDKLNIKSKLYLESYCNNPSDYGWISVIKNYDYSTLLKKYIECNEILDEYSEVEGQYTLVYYEKMRKETGLDFPKDMIEFFREHEPYDGRVKAEEFCSLHMARYKKFSTKTTDEDSISIFESSYLQNQINELLLFHNMDEKSIVKYLLDLGECYKNLAPILIYLTQKDERETILKVSKERISVDKNKPNWIEGVITYISATPYGIKHNIKTFDGIVEYFKKRKNIELEVVKRLKMGTIIIENNDYNVEKGLEKVINAISTYYKYI